MKKILFLIIVLLSLPLVAQSQNTKIHEIGLNFSGPLGIRYRSGSETNLLRLTLTSAYGQHYKYSSFTDVHNSSGLGFNVGFEKRKLLSDKSGIYCGAELLLSYSGETAKQPTPAYNQKSQTYSPGIGLVFGFIYKINDNFNISAEALPNVRYSTSRTSTDQNGIVTKQTFTEYSFGLTNYNLTFSFRFGKEMK